MIEGMDLDGHGLSFGRRLRARVPHWFGQDLFVTTRAKLDATATGRDPTRRLIGETG
jgi:hypothetical protein